jgi:hypothetical protein
MDAFDSSSDDDAVPDHLVESASLLSKQWHPAIIRSLPAGDGLGFNDLEDDLRAIVANLFERAEYGREVRQYLTLQAKPATFEAGDRYAPLSERLETVREHVGEESDIEPETLARTDVETTQ